jgi:hypothetical protein
VDRLEHVERRADAHQVARPVARQERRGELGDRLARAAGLADGEAADGEAVEAVDARERVGAGAAQVLVARALDDREQRLRRVAARRE